MTSDKGRSIVMTSCALTETLAGVERKLRVQDIREPFITWPWFGLRTD